MSQPHPEHQSPPSEGRGGRGSTETRIDPAHVMEAYEAAPAAVREEVVEAVKAASPLVASPSPTELLRIQADQLADYLRTRQRELDHRQSCLNAQLAQFDAANRQARLWLQEKQEELAEQRRLLEEQQRELEDHKARLEAARTNTAQDQATATEELARREEALAQREQEVAHKEEQLCQREAQLEARAEELEARAAAQREVHGALSEECARERNLLQHQRQKIDAHREASLQVIRQLLAGLERRRAALEAEAERRLEQAARPGPDLIARERRAEELLQRLEARQQELDEQEAQLAATRGELERLHAGLAEQRQQAQEQARAERQRLALQQRRALAELEEKRLILQRRSEYLDRCRRDLEQLRAEMGNMHRETLEVRLATEELWLQLSGMAPAAVLTRSLSQLRAKLAEHYRGANEELIRQKEELGTIRTELAQQHERLLQQKRELDRWLAKRQEEIEEQAARLVAREQELDRQETEFKQQARQWQIEQAALRQEIQGLRAQLRDSEPFTTTV